MSKADKLQTRINEGRKRQRIGFKEKYIRNDPDTGTMGEVICKLCGVPLMSQKMLEHRAVRRNGQNYVPMVLTQNSSYYELTIKFKDGSAHKSPTCRGCLKKMTIDDVEAIYAADLAQWKAEGWTPPDNFVDREIEGWE